MKHRNTWPRHVQSATDKFAWPAKTQKVPVTDPCNGDAFDLFFDPARRPVVSSAATWKEITEQTMWDFNYLVDQITQKLRDYSASIGTDKEDEKLTAAVNYIEDPKLSDNTSISIEQMTVEPSFAQVGSQRRIVAVRIEGIFRQGSTAPAGYSSSSSSVNVYP